MPGNPVKYNTGETVRMPESKNQKNIQYNFLSSFSATTEDDLIFPNNKFSVNLFCFKYIFDSSVVDKYFFFRLLIMFILQYFFVIFDLLPFQQIHLLISMICLFLIPVLTY